MFLKKKTIHTRPWNTFQWSENVKCWKVILKADSLVNHTVQILNIWIITLATNMFKPLDPRLWNTDRHTLVLQSYLCLVPWFQLVVREADVFVWGAPWGHAIWLYFTHTFIFCWWRLSHHMSRSHVRTQKPSIICPCYENGLCAIFM